MKIASTALFALFATLAFAPPVHAQAISFLGGTSFTDGPNANVRSFSNGDLQVQASAWSFEGNTLERAFLGHYSTGLGVTNNDEGFGLLANRHTSDNVGQSDFILLHFNRSVNIESAILTPYDVSWDPNDNDALVGYANYAFPFTSEPTRVRRGSSLWDSIFANDYNVAGNMAAPYSTSLDSAGLMGNFWIIGASRPNVDTHDDGFKLSALNVTPAVPEPSTWAMMLIGFGGIGTAMRRRRKTLALAQTA